MKKSVFISYGRSDVAFVRRLAKFLSKSFSVWHDERLSVGDEFSEEIPFRILASTSVIAIWSRSSLRSSWVRSEANHALNLGRLLSISVDGTMPPPPLDTVHTELFNGDIKRIANIIKEKISAMDASEVNFDRSYSEYRKKLDGRVRSVLRMSHSARLKALQAEREGYDIYERADRAYSAAVARRKGHGVIKKGDSMYLGETETPLLSFYERANGYGVFKDQLGTTYAQFSSGTIVGTRVVKLNDDVRIFDIITAGTSSSHRRFVGVAEIYGRLRFEGELSEPHTFVPDGYGVMWSHEGSFLTGNFEYITTESGFDSKPSGLCVAVYHWGETELLDFDE